MIWDELVERVVCVVGPAVAMIDRNVDGAASIAEAAWTALAFTRAAASEIARSSVSSLCICNIMNSKMPDDSTLRVSAEDL